MMKTEHSGMTGEESSAAGAVGSGGLSAGVATAAASAAAAAAVAAALRTQPHQNHMAGVTAAHSGSNVPAVQVTRTQLWPSPLMTVFNSPFYIGLLYTPFKCQGFNIKRLQPKSGCTKDGQES